MDKKKKKKGRIVEGKGVARVPLLALRGLGMMTREFEGPLWCQDPSCIPDCKTNGGEHPGRSQFCCGRVPEPLTFERHGIEHSNDGHFCFKTPIRGVVMLEIRKEDLELIARLAFHSLVARDSAYHIELSWFTGLKYPSVSKESKDEG